MKKRILKNYRYRIVNSRHKKYRSNLCKGSFTIEAACVMSIVLLTVMGVIYLSFFVHNRAWLTAAALRSIIEWKYGGSASGRTGAGSSRNPW